MRMTDADYKAKSIHIFAWPFMWQKPKDDGDDTNREEAFKAALEKNQWKPLEESIRNPDDYMLRQYMTNSSRKIFLETDPEKEKICTRYEKQNIENYKYHIVKQTKKFDFKIDLHISGIELHIYRFGFGILFLRVDNDQDDWNTIKCINDYGRRVSLPIIADSEKKNSLCADELGICAVEEKVNLTPGEQAPFLKALVVGDTFSQPFPADEPTDDRMFLMCLIRNDELSQKLKKIFDDSEGKADELNTEIYPLIFADPDNPTCMNRVMRQQLLEEAVDPRWSEYGTIYAATNTTLLCLTGEDKNEEDDLNAKVVKPFIIEYMYMLSLVIAQRLGISYFSLQAGEQVNGADKLGLISHKQVKVLVNLQERYVAFENQMMILKFTNQDQGIELYQILQKQLQIKEEQSLLDAQLESLYEITNVSNDKWLQWIATLLAVLAIAIDIVLNVVILDKFPYDRKIVTAIITGIISFVIMRITWVRLFRG